MVIALFAALIGPLFIDWTNYRNDFEREASRILGQEVVVHGSADARLLPFPSVTFNDVEVGGSGDEAMMHVARFSMDAELAPFLRGEIRIFDMRIEEPELSIELDENGNLDWATRRAPGLPAGNIVLERVTVSDGTITVSDRQSGRTHVIGDFQSVVSADALTGPWHLEGTAVVNGVAGAFLISTGGLQEDGTIRVRSRLLPDQHPISLELEGSATVEAGKPRYEGNFTLQVLDLAAPDVAEGQPPIPGKAAALRGTGLFEADSQRLRVSEYRLEVGAADDPYVVTGEATLDTGPDPEFLLIADGQQIDVDRLQRDDAEEAEGEAVQPLSAAERLATFRRIVEQIPIPDLPGRVSVVLPAIIAGETVLREVSIDARPDGTRWQVDNFSAALPGRTRLEASGTLGLGDDFGFSGNMVLASSQPSGFAAWLTEEVHPTIRGLDAAGFEAKVDLSQRMQRFENLQLIVGDARLQGRFERISQGGRPSLSLDLQGNSFDLDALTALAGLFTGSGETNRLTRHDIAARLRVEAFQAFGVQMADLDTAFTVHDGLLDVKRLAIEDLEGASLQGSGVFSEITASPQGGGELHLESNAPERLVALAERLSGGAVDLSRFTQSAGLFGDTSLDLVLRLGSARETGAQGQTKGFDVTATGTSGGSAIDFSLSTDAGLGELAGAPVSLDLSAENPRADVLLAQMGLPVLPFDLGGRLALTASLDGVPTDNAAFGLTLEGDSASLKSEGTISFEGVSPAAGLFDVSLRADDISPYLMLAGIALPGFGTGTGADIDAAVSLSEKTIEISGLEGDLSGNAFSGRLDVSREARPHVSGALTFDTLDAGWFAEAVFGEPLRSLNSGAWETTEFPAGTDAGFDADVTIAADRAYVGFAEAAERLQADLSYQDGRLRFGDASASWLGGVVGGNLTLGSSNGSALVQLQMQLSDAYLSRALGEAAPFSGRADLALSLEGSGKSPEALVGALSGEGAMTISDLRIGALDDEALGKILAAADVEGFEISTETVADVAADALTGGMTRIDRATVPLSVAGGTVRASSLVFGNPALEITGGGQADLTEMSARAEFEVAFNAGEESLPGATPALTLRFGGPVDDLERTLDATEMANFLSLRAYERERRRVERVQAQVLEKQRLRREAAYMREQMRERAAAREASEAAEVERLEREARRLEEEARRAAEAERLAAEAAAEAERARREAEEAARAEESDETVPPLDEIPTPDLAPPPPSFDASQQPAPSGEAAGEGAPSPRPAAPESTPAAPAPLPPLNFEGLPGVELPE